MTQKNTLSPHLKDLENESIHILREVAGQFDKVGLLFSGGKDSVVVFELARRAFAPAVVPFELVHVDTGHNFPEVIEFRDRLVTETGARLHEYKRQLMNAENRIRTTRLFTYAHRNDFTPHLAHRAAGVR